MGEGDRRMDPGVASLSCLPRELCRLVLEYLSFRDLMKLEISINNHELKYCYLEAVTGIEISDLSTQRLNSSQVNWLLDRKIPSPVLKFVSCDESGTELISRNQAILTHLEICQTTISSLPLFSFPKLISLAFYGCQFLPENNVLDIFSLNLHLRCLALSSVTFLEESQLDPLFSLISNSFPNLTDLDLANNQWLTGIHLSHFLQQPSSLLTLNLYQSLEPEDEPVLEDVIESHPNLQSVTFSSDASPNAALLALEHVALPSLMSDDLQRQERGLNMTNFYSIDTVMDDGLLIDGLLPRLFEILSQGPPSHQILAGEILSHLVDQLDERTEHLEFMIEAGLIPHITNLVHSGNAEVLSSLLLLLGALIKHQPQFWEEIHKEDSQRFIPLLVSAFQIDYGSRVFYMDFSKRILSCLHRASISEISEFISSVIPFAYSEFALICLRALSQTQSQPKKKIFRAICQPNVVTALIRLAHQHPHEPNHREIYCQTLHAIFVTNPRKVTVPIDVEVFSALISFLSCGVLNSKWRSLICECLSAAVKRSLPQSQSQPQTALTSNVIPFLLAQEPVDDVVKCLLDITTHALNTGGSSPFLRHLVDCGLLPLLITVLRPQSIGTTVNSDIKFIRALSGEVCSCLKLLLQADEEFLGAVEAMDLSPSEDANVLRLVSEIKQEREQEENDEEESQEEGDGPVTNVFNIVINMPTR